MILAPTLFAALAGSMNWETAAPLLAAGVVGLVWPENTALKAAAKTTVSDMAAMMTAFRGVNGGKPSTDTH